MITLKSDEEEMGGKRKLSSTDESIFYSPRDIQSMSGSHL